MNFKNLLYNTEEKIGLITINRPSKLNALNSETLDELQTLFENVEKDNSINVVIITGAGDKAFVAGADINELRECNYESGISFSEKGQNVFNLIENFDKPVIAAVNGFALGGGCELALACHIRLASANSKFGQPEVNLGIIPGYGGTQRLSRMINTGRAAEYILTGDMISAEEALNIGLVNKIFTNENLIDEAKKMANRIAEKGQIAIRLALKSIQSTNNKSQIEGLKFETKLFAECCNTADFKEGTSAFLEKRKPNFKNK
ncbi:MAG: enoyl-CoA hydratase/isomerase family protein [Ignavibacteriales bacterium]|nr:enoyl-CoA hydratase/isomerase family protein [Ignavibacteriales bacterium]